MTRLPLDDHASGAVQSPDGAYRYALWRKWNPHGPVLGFVMLNPSTADHVENDATIRRCIAFARRDGYGGIAVRNLYAWRATDPADLRTAQARGTDIVGSPNRHYLAGLATDAIHVCLAWGAPSRPPRGFDAHRVAMTKLLVDAGAVLLALEHPTVTMPHPVRLPAAARFRRITTTATEARP